MGGSMFVRTKQRVGSVFGFRIQLRAVQAARRAESDDVPEGLRVLLADFKAKGRDQLVSELQRRNTVVVEERGENARRCLDAALASGRAFDLCLIGAELLHNFLYRPGELPNVPLVVMHAVTSRTKLAEIRWPGGKAALARPVAARESLLVPGANSNSTERAACRAADARSSRIQPRGRARQSRGRARAGFDRHARGLAPRKLRLAVLVAEDNPVNQLIIRRFLAKLDLPCTLVTNGQEAVEATRQSSFDLIFMDVQMPVMDGVDAVRIIREEEPDGVRVPIAALTANVLAADRDYYLGAGFDFHLPKPLKFEVLQNFLAELPVAKGT